MKNAEEKLSFAQQYLEWKRAKEWIAQQWTPEEFLEEAILKEKAEVFDKIYDILTEEGEEEPGEILDRIYSLVVNP